MLIRSSVMMKNSNGPKPPEGKIHFIASKNFENMSSYYDFSHLQVWIIDQLTGQVAHNISVKVDDDAKIIATKKCYPWFGYFRTGVGSNIDCIKKICELLPLMHDWSTNPIISAAHMFYDCHSLESMPVGLFDNNPQLTNFFHVLQLRRCTNRNTKLLL